MVDFYAWADWLWGWTVQQMNYTTHGQIMTTFNKNAVCSQNSVHSPVYNPVYNPVHNPVHNPVYNPVHESSPESRVQLLQ